MSHSCRNCNYFYYSAPQHDQPYPEYACKKWHWDGIGSAEEYEQLSKDNNCKDFELPPF